MYDNNSDKFWMVIGFISFIFIVVVVAMNYNTETIDKSFHMGEYYEPAEYRTAVQAADSLYQQMVGSYDIGCPQSNMKKSELGLIYIDKLNSPYIKQVFPFAFSQISILGTSTVQMLDSTNMVWRDGYEMVNDYYTVNHYLGIESSAMNSYSGTVIKDLFPNAFINGREYIEIIAPFDFTFVNNNTDSEDEPEDIIIVSNDGSIMMKFKNCANWFCAGSPYEEQEMEEYIDRETDEQSLRVVDWKYHARTSRDTEQVVGAHYTIVGSSANATINGGSSGCVIGYADDNTTMEILYRNVAENRWMTITIKDWLVNP